MTPRINEITLIEKQKKAKARYNVYVNEQYAFSVHEDVLIKHRLKKGAIIDLQYLEEIMQDEEHNQAFHRALKYISYRPKSIKEVERRLIELEFNEDIVESVIGKLQELNYLNDREYAIRLAQYRIQSQHKGKRWISQELREKGVSSEHIAYALEQVDQSSEWEAAYVLARKRLPKHGKVDQKTIQKIGAFLLRRGFETSMVMRIVNDLADEHKQ